MRPRDDVPARLLAERLAAELRRKDERLRKLDSAVKTIQGELADVLKKVWVCGGGAHQVGRSPTLGRSSGGSCCSCGPSACLAPKF